jgi:hypothetical protein
VNRIRTWVVTALLTCLAFPASAQNCEAILKYGVFDVRAAQSSAHYAETMNRHFCKDKTSETGGGLTVPIYGVPVTGTAFQNRRKAICETLNTSRSLDETNQSFVREASTAILDAWQGCMGRTGMQFSLVQTGQPKFVRGIVRYRKPGTGAAASASGAAVLRFLKPGSCKCEDTSDGSECQVSEDKVSFTIPDDGTQSFICTRDNTGPVEATLSSPMSQTQDYFLAALALSPRLTLTPGTFGSNGRCNGNIATVPLVKATLIAEDIPADSPFALYYRGQSSNLGSLSLQQSEFPYVREGLKLGAVRKDNTKDGIYAGVDDQRVMILKQHGNYDCSDDIGYARIARFELALMHRSILD